MKKKIFQELVDWITDKEDISIQIDTSYYEHAKTKTEDRIVNGVAGSDGYIILYADKSNMDWEKMTSMLIHEIGHVILFQEGKCWHTEKDAWICGIQTVPKKFHPKLLGRHCMECLKTYDYKRFGWIKKLLG
jgi:hypothetical protein